MTDEYEGACEVCGWLGTFKRQGGSSRETYRCGGCQASLRYRAQAAVLVERLSRRGARSLAELAEEPHLRALAVFEPGVLGPFRRYLRQAGTYKVSDYWPDVAPGAQRDGVECQDLMNLTFPVESFDLVVTSDIFEHVRHPMRAFREIRRVSRPDGLHVFSIPVENPFPEFTRARVDVAGPDDKFLTEPRYHLGPRGSRHLV